MSAMTRKEINATRLAFTFGGVVSNPFVGLCAFETRYAKVMGTLAGARNQLELMTHCGIRLKKGDHADILSMMDDISSIMDDLRSLRVDVVADHEERRLDKIEAAQVSEAKSGPAVLYANRSRS